MSCACNVWSGGSGTRCTTYVYVRIRSVHRPIRSPLLLILHSTEPATYFCAYLGHPPSATGYRYPRWLLPSTYWAGSALRRYIVRLGTAGGCDTAPLPAVSFCSTSRAAFFYSTRRIDSARPREILNTSRTRRVEQLL